ncbi:Sterol desaturase/sphingolipid hydroxylase, fatty acid hydroxylase superfamily [Robiginitalea myxolifaciens]|uniref:Sterol desaturase/sphingolipid hydroxylase, fatty acid hydroxylase superfamily n=1 Tax=Robiginitalea myxolifaciens TaxID=400055 RepID=A0A1I6HFZ5_9FLAO|nr:sterol desaturase family protein [Robiginitalea myxolifaciens]SFR53413.1 Sterol desaturase/sphingolipid hydroxylase, fatty acid hydroxylase superfamily [Robiginitalea myxolifaciens]
MEQIISYFENIPSTHRSLLLVGGITFFWLMEGAVPLFRFSYRKWRHALPNFFFTLTTIIINFALAFLLLQTSDWVKANDFGIINWLPAMPLWAYVFLGVLLLDFFGAYLAHLVEHKVKPLWMIHLVHHTDHEVDTTTANRHHPLESLIRFSFTLLGVFLSGASIGIVMLYQSLSLVATQFGHANIKLPRRVDKAISWIFVSPDMHKVHHHYVLPYTDSNYGNIFSIWDRLLGTYMELDRDSLVYGVDTFPDRKENGSIWGLLKQPFHKYRRPTTINRDT